MPVYHATFFFSTKDHGWVEQLYCTGFSLTEALGAARALAGLRYGILGAGVALHRVRVTEVGTPRAVASQSISGTTLTIPCMSAYEVAEVRLEGEDRGLYHRSYALHGLPVGSILNPKGASTWAPFIQSAALLYLRRLTAGWLMKVRQNIGPPLALSGVGQAALADNSILGNPLHPRNPPPGTALLMVQALAPFPLEGDQIQIAGVKTQPNLPRMRHAVNGTHDIVYRRGDTIYFFGDFGGGEFSASGSAQLQRSRFASITLAQLTRAGTRKVGPPTCAFPLVFPASPNPAPVIQQPPPPPQPPLEAPRNAPVPFAPATLTLHSARELARQIYTSYVNPQNPRGDLLQIAPIIPTPGTVIERIDRPTYMVLISGLDVHRSDSLPQLLEIMGQLGGTPDPISPVVKEIIKLNTPEPCDLYLCGDSLGGTTCEWLLNPLQFLGDRRIMNIVTFGAPAVGIFISAAYPITRFACGTDPIPWLGPVGWWFYPRVLLAIGSAGITEFVNYAREFAGLGIFTHFDENTGNPGPYHCHTTYDQQAALNDYDVFGKYNPGTGGNPVVLGPVQRFNPVIP